MVECPGCGSINIKHKIFKPESSRPSPFVQYCYECQDCKCFWFDRNDGGKGVL
jgi:uncharacterized Zn finger protein